MVPLGAFHWQNLFKQSRVVRDRLAVITGDENRPFATNGHMVQNPPYWRASSLLLPHWDKKNKGQSSLTDWGLFVLTSQCGNNNELALQYGGFCTMWSFVAKGLLSGRKEGQQTKSESLPFHNWVNFRPEFATFSWRPLIIKSHALINYWWLQSLQLTSLFDSYLTLIWTKLGHGLLAL